MKILVVCAAILAGVSAMSYAEARALTLEDRVAAQKAIEQVYWSHRVWPKENRTPKPQLEAVMSDGAIRARVEDYLRKSNALEQLWRRPITGAQLQAEMNRMAKSSHDPQLLGELFAALGNDPLVIAETLARETLADRLIRNWYSSDMRFHGNVRKRAEAALATCAQVDCMDSVGGEYGETTFRLRGDKTEGEAIDLGAEEWRDLQDRLAAALHASSEVLPTGRLGSLEETDEAFVVRAVLGRTDGEIVTASLTWSKRAFDTWWQAERGDRTDVIDQPRAAYAVPASSSSPCTINSWTAMVGANPDLRSEHTAVWTGSEMIIWGGKRPFGPTNVMNTGYRYDPATDTWAKLPNFLSARFGHTAVWTGTEMIVWGGTQGSSTISDTNTGGRYNPSTDSWMSTSTVTMVPVKRWYHSAVWTGTEMIVWGGVRCDSPTQYCNSVRAESTGGRYDPSSDSWTATSTGANVPGAQSGHTAVWTGTEMIIWGWPSARYNPSSDLWLPIGRTGDPPPTSSESTAVWTGTELIVWGGYLTANSYMNIGGRYNPSSDSWTATSTGANCPSGRIYHKAVWTGTEMIVWGGRDAGHAWTNSGGVYNPLTDTWTPTSTGANNPFGRINHTAVWTGTEMIVWGGSYSSNESAVTNTGGRYSPSTDSWTPTAAWADAPSMRDSHAAVWTGTEMIVWGGNVYNSTYYNTGGRYTPSIDAWTVTSTGANVPSARSSTSTVWTGTEMIVWGGYDGSSQLNTGGRYNPVTDSWVATNTGPNVPSARALHTAVWTGDEMIVWGGFFGTVNTGGRYDPSTDSWTPTSTGANDPSARNGHTAVWTGTRMIVWGGYPGSGTTKLNTGGVYDPSTDSWTATSTGANNPVARDGHVAVWTGTEMVVWGGGNGSSLLNSGGRYRPLSNSWLATSMGLNVPPARIRPTAVWTGMEMLVWGGYDGTPLDTGGRYNPLFDYWTPVSPGEETPPGRSLHSAVYTGTEMLVWGGEPASGVNGRYCACPNGRLYYRDADGDGFGNAEDSILACDRVPAGYVADATDCNDAQSSIHRNAPEVNDGIDNQCPGDPDYGLIDEISGASGFMSPGDNTRFAWTAQQGATSYDVVRSTTADFSAGCTLMSTSQTFIVDPEEPPGGSGFYYLVRSSTPSAGSWGQRSDGVPRTVDCFAAVPEP